MVTPHRYFRIIRPSKRPSAGWSASRRHMSSHWCRGFRSPSRRSTPAAKCCSRSPARRTARIPSARRSGSWTRLRFRRIFVDNDIGRTPCALVVMGVSGSGKSTIGERLAQRLGWSYEDGDKFHPLSNVAKMSAGQPLTDEDRWPWLQAIANEIDRVCEAREHAVIACSALKRAYRDILVHGRPDVRIIYLKGTPD